MNLRTTLLYLFLNFLSTIIGGGMVYVGVALKGSKFDLSVSYQIMAVVMLLATWLLLTVKIKKND